MTLDMVSSLVRKAIAVITIAYTLAMTIGALIPPVRLENAPTFFDKMLHSGAHFGLVTLWVLWAVIGSTTSPWKTFTNKITRIIGLIFIGAVVYGILIEVLQGTITDYRTPDVYDVLANTSGALLAVIVGLIWRKQLEGLKS